MQTCDLLTSLHSWIQIGDRACIRCAKASRIEAVIWRGDKVGDKLQSCRPKWFMASAESDKFCPLCSTNHCGLSQTESWRSRSWCKGGRLPQTHPCGPLHALRRALFMHEFTDCQTYRNQNTVWASSASPAGNRTKKDPFFCPLCAFCDSQEARKCTPQHKNVHIYHS